MLFGRSPEIAPSVCGDTDTGAWLSAQYTAIFSVVNGVLLKRCRTQNQTTFSCLGKAAL